MTLVIAGASRETWVLPAAGRFPAIFYWKCYMKELSIFVDESGDFGDYDYRSPYYILTMVFHDQAVNISNDLQQLQESINQYRMLCTLELLSEKAKRKMLSKSEFTFFTSERRLKKTYLRTLEKKRF